MHYFELFSHTGYIYISVIFLGNLNNAQNSPLGLIIQISLVHLMYIIFDCLFYFLLQDHFFIFLQTESNNRISHHLFMQDHSVLIYYCWIFC